MATNLDGAPKRTAKSVAPKGAKSKEDRDKLAKRIAETIRAGQEEKGQLTDRIKVNEQYFQNKGIAPPKLPWPEAQFFEMPLVGPRLNQRKANIVGTITSPDRVFRFWDIGSRERVERVEADFQFFLDIVGWRETLDATLEMAMYANAPTLRITFQEYENGYYGASHTGHFAGVVFDVIHPECFVVYPANKGGIPNSRVCGHKFECRRAEIKQRQKQGEYFDDVVTPAQDKAIAEEGQTPRITSNLQNYSVPVPETPDENIQMWDVIWRDDLNGDGIEELYRVILTEKSPDIYLIEPYTSKFHNYVNIAMKKEWNRFWAESSPANEAQGLQILTNSLVNNFIWGIQMASRPPIITEGNSKLDSLVQYEPGEIRQVRSVGKMVPVPTQFNPAGMDYLIGLVRSFSDSVTKTSDAVTGAPASTAESTATEQNIKFQGFQIASSDDITSITGALKQMVLVTFEKLIENFPTWYKVYGKKSEDPEDQGSILTQDIREWKKPYRVELSGRVPEDSPQLQTQQAEQMLQLASQFPQSGIPVMELIKAIVESSNLSNKEDIIRDIDQSAQQQAIQQQQQMISQQQLMQIMAQAAQQQQEMQQGQQPQTTNADPDQERMATLLALVAHAATQGGPQGMAQPGQGPVPGVQPQG